MRIVVLSWIRAVLSRLPNREAATRPFFIRMSSNEPELKKPCTVKTIGTHDGTFHCDEALACYMLRLLPEFKDARIVRTRDPVKLEPCDIVVDVGGVYDPNTQRYDHHQRMFNSSMSRLTDGKKPWVTKLSSAGLVYLHFGHRVIATIVESKSSDSSPDSSLTEELYDRTYANFIEEIDAVDNGISDRDGNPRYRISSTIGARVSRLNPAWNDANKDFDGRFQQAMQLVGQEFTQCVLRCKDCWLPARHIVQKALDTRSEVHGSGEIVRFDESCPWKEHLYELEEKMAVNPNVKFVLYKELDSTKWRIQAVSVCPGSFTNRLSLLSTWCGLRDEELSKTSEIPGCVFVHSNGFIGGNKTYEGALQMAVQTLESASNDINSQNKA